MPSCWIAKQSTSFLDFSEALQTTLECRSRISHRYSQDGTTRSLLEKRLPCSQANTRQQQGRGRRIGKHCVDFAGKNSGQRIKRKWATGLAKDAHTLAAAGQQRWRMQSTHGWQKRSRRRPAQSLAASKRSFQAGRIWLDTFAHTTTILAFAALRWLMDSLADLKLPATAHSRVWTGQYLQSIAKRLTALQMVHNI